MMAVMTMLKLYWVSLWMRWLGLAGFAAVVLQYDSMRPFYSIRLTKGQMRLLGNVRWLYVALSKE